MMSDFGIIKLTQVFTIICVRFFRTILNMDEFEKKEKRRDKITKAL